MWKATHYDLSLYDRSIPLNTPCVFLFFCVSFLQDIVVEDKTTFRKQK